MTTELEQRIAALSPEQLAMLLERIPPVREGRDAPIVPRERPAALEPLSFAQQRLWFLDRLAPGSAFYHVPAALHLEGPLDVDALRDSLGEIVRRHEALRTTFATEAGQVFQRVRAADRVAFELPVAELAALRPDERAAQLAALRRDAARRPFDLARGPLFRAALVRLAPGEHELLLSFHHIVCDGWSLGVFVRELTALYEARCAGAPSPLPPPRLQPADVARWQQHWLDERALAPQLAYWRRRLAGEIPMLGLPLDRARPPAQSFRGARHRLLLPRALADATRRLADAERATPFMVLFAVYGMLLHRLSGQPSLWIGCPVAQRHKQELEPILGFLVNTLVMTVDARPGRSFRELLAEVRATTLDAFDHQDLPFERVVEALQPVRDLSHAPLFQAAFVLQNAPLPAPRLGRLAVTPVPVDAGTARFDLTLQITEDARGLELDVEYATDLFDAATIERWTRMYRTLLVSVLADPRQRTGDAPALDPQERAHVLALAAGPCVPRRPGDRLHDAFERQVEARPDAVAVVFDGRALSYRELDGRANQVAHALRRRGVARDARVAVCMERSLELAVALLAVVKAGGAYVPIEPSQPRARIARMLADIAPPVVLAQDALGDTLRALHPTVVCLDGPGAPWTHEPSQAPSCDAGPDDLAYAIYTSGSTGAPKAAMITHAAICNRLDWMQDAYGLGPDDAVLQKTPLGFDVSVWELFWPWRQGARLVMALPECHRDAGHLAETIARERITAVHFTPSMLHAFLAHPASASCTTLAAIYCSGEALSPALAAAARSRLPTALHNLYGPTEAAIDVTAWSCPRAGPLDVVPIGRPIANTRVHVLDASLAPAPIGVPGELYIGGAAVGRGYVARPALTAAAFVPDPFSAVPGGRLYRTGDRARLRDDGEIEFLGRVDHQLKIRGIRIEPAEIEAAVTDHPGVRAAVVGAYDVGPADRRLVCWWVAASVPPTVGELRGHIAERLPAALVPQQFVRLPALPRTPSGKIDRRALAVPPDAAGERERAYVPPRTTTEARLATAWSALLGADPIGSEDDFFVLGGHSLLALQLIERVRGAFGIEVPLRELFRRPTLGGLARAIDELAAATTGAALAPWPAAVPDPARRHEPFALNEVQQAYWIGRRGDFALGNIAAHLYVEIDSPGESAGNGSALTVEAIEGALDRLIARHDMLRAVVDADGRQRVLAEVPPYRVAHSDLRGAAPQGVAMALAEIRERMSHQVLPSDRWPLFELRVSTLPGGVVRLHISLDLLIGDALSWIILLSELGRLARDPAHELPPVGLTFRDYLTAEAEVRGGDGYRRARDYWRKRLDRLPPAPELPLVKPLHGVQRPRFTRREARLDPPRWRALKAWAARLGVTPSGVLLAAFAEVLARWSRSPRFTLNVTLFNRLPVHPDVNRVIGDFTSLTLLEVDLAADDGFASRARRIQEQLFCDLDNRQVSAVEVLRMLRERTQDTVMPVVFSSTLGQTAPDPNTPVLADLGELVYGITQTPQIYLDHQVWEDRGALRFNWDVIDELLAPGVADDMFAAYTARLDELADRPDAAGPARDPLPARQREARRRYNATAAPLPDGLLHGRFLAQAARAPDRPAVIAPDRTLTYGELARVVRSAAGWLRRAGAAPNRLVAVVMEKGWQQVAALLAVLESGAAYLPIDPELPPQRIQWLLAHGEASLAVTQARVADRVAWPDGVTRLCIDGRELDAGSPHDGASAARPGDLAYVLYTSGTTGTPKGVAIEHRAALNTIVDVNRRFGVTAGDRVLGVSAASFDLSVYDVFGTLAAGATLVLPAPSATPDPDDWLRCLCDERVTIWSSVPGLLELVVERAAHTGPIPTALRLALLSGDWISTTLPGRLRAIAPETAVVSLGGATEASIWSIWFPIDRVEPSWTSIPYGAPMANQRVYVLDAALDERPDGVTGDLWIGGAGLAREYWREPELTRAAFVVHPRTGERLYRTGDLGRFHPDGVIELLGREDAQVKIGGYRIELGEIEAALLRHPAVRAACVRAVDDGRGRRALAAWAVAATGADGLTAEGLRAFVAEALPAYMVPTTLSIVEQIPRSANGKIDVRGAVTARATTGDPAAAAIQDTLIADVTALVAGVLGVERLEPDDDLFALGATSVDVVRIANGVAARYRHRVRFVELYRRATVAALAAAIARTQAAPGDPPTASTGGAAPTPGPTILEPADRERFKQQRPGLRRWSDARALALPDPVPLDVRCRELAARASRRQFATDAIPLASFGGLLGSLRELAAGGAARRGYASAGGLYPVQVYAHVKPGRVATLGGVYYHDPIGHQLVWLSPGERITRELHEPFINRPIFDACGFGLFLVAQLAAIEPLYDEHARSLCLVEAGYIAQQLMTRAADHGIGLCPISGLDVGPIRDELVLDPTHALVHALLGGRLADAARPAVASEGQGAFEEGEL